MESLHKLFLGSSWLTSVLGYIGAIVIAGQDYFTANGDLSHINWSQLLLAILVAVFGRVTKQGNVSNAPNPLPQAQTVEPILKQPAEPK